LVVVAGMVLPSGRIYSVTLFPEYGMKQIDYLIDAIKTDVSYHASVGVGTRIQVLVASQNKDTVRKAIGELAHSILRGTEWENQDLSQTELELRTNILLKDLFYSKRIVIELKQKQWPETVGNHLDFDVSGFDKLIYDQDTCDSYAAYLARQN
jgi:hypothetical protein